MVRPWAQYGLPLEERTLPQALEAGGIRDGDRRQVAPRAFPARIPADTPRVRPSVRPLQRCARLLHPHPRRRLRLASRRPREPRRGLQHPPPRPRGRPPDRRARPRPARCSSTSRSTPSTPRTRCPTATRSRTSSSKSPAGPTPGCSPRWTRRSGRSSRRSTARDPQGHAVHLLQRQRRPEPRPGDEQRPAPRREGDALRGGRPRPGVRDLGGPRQARLGRRTRRCTRSTGIRRSWPSPGRRAGQSLPIDGRDAWPSITEGKPSPTTRSC